MSTKPRTPKHFPRMKHRAAKRVARQERRERDRATFNNFWAALWDAFTPATQADFILSPPPLEPTHPPTEAAPNRAAFPLSGEKP